jgi:hypothetical protein
MLRIQSRIFRGRIIIVHCCNLCVEFEGGEEEDGIVVAVLEIVTVVRLVNPE